MAIIMPHRIIRSWYTGRWWMGCYIWYSEEGPGWAAAPPSPLLAVRNITAYLSAANVPITVLLYDGPLLCGFNVAIKGLRVWPRDLGLKCRDLYHWCCVCLCVQGATVTRLAQWIYSVTSQQVRVPVGPTLTDKTVTSARRTSTTLKQDVSVGRFSLLTICVWYVLQF